MVDDEEHRVVFVDTAEGLVFHCICVNGDYIRIGGKCRAGGYRTSLGCGD